MRTFVGLLALLSFLVPAYAVDCPPGYVCLEQGTYDQVKALLVKLKKVEDTKPALTLDPIYIVTDRQGRVFSSGADPKPAGGKLTWGDFEAELTWTPVLTVSQVEEADWGFRFRVKAGLWYDYLDATLDPWQKPFDFGVFLEPFHLWWANVQVYAGLQSFGAAVGFDFTRNFGAVLGVGGTYVDTHLAPMGGLFFSFN